MTLQQIIQMITVADCGSMNEAAKQLYLTQPGLSSAVKELEKELGITIFHRTNRGIGLTAEGEEFLGYARQVAEQYQLLADKYTKKEHRKERFSVSMQHYSFAVEAFIKVAGKFGMEEYEFAVHECKTAEVIENVRIQKSEIGVIYQNEFNERILEKILRDDELEFIPLFDCPICVYLSREHPLAGEKNLTFEDLAEYPCLSFEQGQKNSFYFAEEVFSTHDYKKLIKADDRATMLNLMTGLNGYTFCSGIICEDLNGNAYKAVPFQTGERMSIGYIKKRKFPLSRLGQCYIEELKKYAVPTIH